MEIATGLSAVKTAVDLLTGLRDALTTRELKPHEIQSRIAEMQDLLLNARMALLDAKEEEATLKSRITELERVRDISKDFEYEEGVYWHRGYPYCVNCWDSDRKPIRLEGPYRIANTQSSEYRQWTCPIHKTKYYLKRMPSEKL